MKKVVTVLWVASSVVTIVLQALTIREQRAAIADYALACERYETAISNFDDRRSVDAHKIQILSQVNKSMRAELDGAK